MKYPFGEKLRQVRERRGLTMKEVAQRAELSESLISQIERNRVSPALDTLLTLVDVLDVDLEYLFADFRREREVRVVRREGRRIMEYPGVRYQELASAGEHEEHGMQAWLLELQPGCSRGNGEYGHPGRELGIIVRGKAEFRSGSKSWQLAEGDSISFNADVPHQLVNVGEGPLQAYWMVTPPRKD